ncbi:MAG: hypothetical protein ACQETI_04990 [Halobacteriota archaeon]
MPSRRRVLRTVGGALAAGTAVATAGCLGRLRVVSSSGSSSGPVPTASDDSNRLTHAEFDAYADRMDARYGDNGVWGTGDPPDGDASFVGAWTARFVTGDARSGGDGSGLARGDFALARYDLGTRGEDEQRVFAHWLWGGASPTSERVDVEVAPGVSTSAALTLRGLGAAVAVGDSEELSLYDPAGDVRGPTTLAVGFSRPDGMPVSASFPLHAGLVRPSSPRTWNPDVGTGQDTDSYVVGWQGHRAGVQSVNAVCETVRPADADPDDFTLGWRVHVAAGGYV